MKRLIPTFDILWHWHGPPTYFTSEFYLLSSWDVRPFGVLNEWVMRDLPTRPRSSVREWEGAFFPHNKFWHWLICPRSLLIMDSSQTDRRDAFSPKKQAIAYFHCVSAMFFLPVAGRSTCPLCSSSSILKWTDQALAQERAGKGERKRQALAQESTGKRESTWSGPYTCSQVREREGPSVKQPLINF